MGPDGRDVGGQPPRFTDRLRRGGSIAVDELERAGGPVSGRPDANGQRATGRTGSQWLERWNQLDLNLRKNFKVGKVGFEPGVDVYNVFNTNPVLTENQQFGSSLGTPMRILQGRLMRLTAQITF